MKPNTSFQELARLAMEQIEKQGPVTLEQARGQVLWIKDREFFIKRFSAIGDFEDARKNAIEYLKDISEEDYKALHNEFRQNQFNKVKGYNLFLDDIRTVDMVYGDTETEFVVVRSYVEFIRHVGRNGVPGYISFDNDLGEDYNGRIARDGYACAKWLVYESGLDLTGLRFHVHSANPVAKEQIKGLLNNYLKFIKEEKK
jgi:hypothetical protein